MADSAAKLAVTALQELMELEMTQDAGYVYDCLDRVYIGRQQVQRGALPQWSIWPMDAQLSRRGVNTEPLEERINCAIVCHAETGDIDNPAAMALDLAGDIEKFLAVNWSISYTGGCAVADIDDMSRVIEISDDDEVCSVAVIFTLTVEP